MERKIGEIFEYNGEWYQCVRSILTCSACEIPRPCTKIRGLGYCSLNMRNDKEQVVFKKLEKVGEPRWFGRKLMQPYKLYVSPVVPHELGYFVIYLEDNKTIDIEIKQTKEDMEENKLNLKPFDIQKAREGKPVCTRDGRKVRIICFDRINGDYYKIVACVTAFDGDFEEVLFYGIDGYIVNSQNPKDEDLMMLPEKKEGWVNVYKTSINYECGTVFSTEQEAKNKANNNRIATIRIEWEE